jgi:hypothetical protein
MDKEEGESMNVSIARVSTENASSYLRKLCQHWSHKFLVSFDAQHGTIDLAVGKCILDAEENALKVRLELVAEGNEARLQQIVEEHIKRFAFRETLVFDWNSAAA